MGSTSSTLSVLRVASAALLVLGCGAATEGARPVSGKGLVFVDDGKVAHTIGPQVEEGPERPYFHDFGRVPDGDVVTHVFRLRNTDPDPIAITRIVPGCGCTVPTVRYIDAAGSVIQGEPVGSEAEELISIPPGAIAEIELRIDTADMRQKNLDKLLLVTVTTDSENRFYINLEVHIVVTRPFDIVPPTINLGRIPENGTSKGTVDVVPTAGFQNTIGEVLAHSNGTSVEVVPFRSGDRVAWRAEVTIEPPLELGLWKGEFSLATRDGAGAAGDPVMISVSALVVRDIQADPTRLAFYADPDAEAHSRLASLLPGQRLRVLEVTVAPEHAEMLTVRCEPDQPDGQGKSVSWSLSMRPRPPLTAPGGVLRGMVRVTLDDPQNPEVVVPYAVHVREP